jgi:hypothetical protein
MPGVRELPVSRIYDGRNYRFFVLKTSIIAFLFSCSAE